LACTLRQTGVDGDGGVKAAGACSICAKFADPAARRACFECVGGAKTCNGCLPQPQQQASPSITAQQQLQQQGITPAAAALSEQCFACVARASTTAPGAYDTRDCVACISSTEGVASPTAANVGACFACASSGAPTVRAACGGCYGASSVAARERCLKCAASTSIPSVAAACGGCAAPATNATADACYKCLETNNKNGFSASFCTYPRPDIPSAAAPYYACLSRTKYSINCPACANGALSPANAVQCLNTATAGNNRRR
jgi:hypothetical protein